MDNEIELNKKKTFNLVLTQAELSHLVDLFGVLLPPDLKSTVSQALAHLKGMPMIETKLWNKVSELAEEAEIPTGDDAADYLIAASGPPVLGVFKLSSELEELGEEPESDDDSIFE